MPSYEHLMHYATSPALALSMLFVMGFLSSTLLPLDASPLLAWVVTMLPQWEWLALIVVATGNTLGGIFTYYMGLFGKKTYDRFHQTGSVTTKRHLEQDYPRLYQRLRQYGPILLLLSWVPIIGDPLCAVAGWLKLNPKLCFLYIAIGKLARFGVVFAVVSWWLA